ncbi:MAG: hypothetical protein WA990_07080 [Rubrobacteraceae bacterium]
METFLNIAVGLMRLVPLILIFYIPALIGTVIWSERSEAYRVKAAAWYALGFGGIVAVHLMLRSGSAIQIIQTLSISLVQIAAALLLAVFTVYKLAD